jgi:hypothetical protein
MVSGIICLVVSGIFLISGFAVSASGVLQQQVQYLMYVCSAILFVGGFILLKLNVIINKLSVLDKDNPQKKRINELKEKFGSSSNEDEKQSIALELVELGETDFKKYLR